MRRLHSTCPACCLLHRFQVHAPNSVCLPLLLPQNAGDAREAMAQGDREAERLRAARVSAICGSVQLAFVVIENTCTGLAG